MTEVKLIIRIAGMVVGNEHWDSASMPKCREPFLSGFQLLKVVLDIIPDSLSWWGPSNLGWIGATALFVLGCSVCPWIVIRF